MSVIKESTKPAVNCVASNGLLNVLFDRFSYAGFSVVKMRKIIFCKETDGANQNAGSVSRIRDG